MKLARLQYREATRSAAALWSLKMRENKNKPLRGRTVTKLRELRQRRRRTATRTAKRQTGWIKKKTLHVHHAVLYLSLPLPSLHNHKVKLPNFSFCGERETQDKDFLFF